MSLSRPDYLCSQRRQNFKLTLILYEYTLQIFCHILIFTQQVRLEDARANELEGRKVIGLVGATTAGQRSRQHISTESNHFDVSLSPKLSAGLNVDQFALYIIKESPGKGLGMFATTGIQKGTRILAEKPFFTLARSPELSWSDPYAPNDMSEAYNRLPDSKRLKYIQLHCPKRTDCSILVSIYEANCFEMGSGDCVCIDASRLNHSCIPNAHYSWNENIKSLTVHAVKDIPEGEEITISYCSGFRTLEARRRKLKPYVFTCLCSACQEDTNFGRLSRTRRREMVDLRQEIADYQNDPSGARAKYVYCDEQTAILELLRVIDEEGLIHEKSMAYRDAVDWALKKGYSEVALKYASKELEVDLCCTGIDSPSYQETKSFLQRIYDEKDE